MDAAANPPVVHGAEVLGSTEKKLSYHSGLCVRATEPRLPLLSVEPDLSLLDAFLVPAVDKSMLALTQTV